jgi:hypothetical protein
MTHVAVVGPDSRDAHHNSSFVRSLIPYFWDALDHRGYVVCIFTFMTREGRAHPLVEGREETT